jgi:tetratricopeptide (TPR) repeat protein
VSVPRHTASQLRRELAQHHDGSTFAPDRVLTTLHAVLDEPETAVALLAEVWPVVPPDVEQDWIRQTSDVGAHLLTVLPTSLLLATVFRRAARTLRAHGHLRLAAVHGMRELAIHRQRDDDPDATAASLHDLAEAYRAQGRMHKVIGCADETLETYLLNGHKAGVARTLAHLGALMSEVGRHDAAVKYFTRADTAYEVLPDIIAWAECLAGLGRTLWLSGDQTTAHRVLNRALAVVIGSQGSAVRHVRAFVEETRQSGVGARDGVPGGSAPGRRRSSQSG